MDIRAALEELTAGFQELATREDSADQAQEEKLTGYVSCHEVHIYHRTSLRNLVAMDMHGSTCEVAAPRLLPSNSLFCDIG